MTRSSKNSDRRGRPHREGRAGQPGDLRFAIAIVLVLLAGAVIANRLAPEPAHWPQYLFQALIWLVTVFILLNTARSTRPAERGDGASTTGTARRSPLGPRGARAIRVALGVTALLAVMAHYNFGRFHGEGRFLHHHELYHYCMGSKYFAELGYDGLYAATHRALLENDRSIASEISAVKNLRTYQRENAAISLERSAGVAALFTEPRWQEFKRDVGFFQTRIPPKQWQLLLVDHGFNATPFWTLVGSTLSANLPINGRTLRLLASLDVVLIAGLLLLVGYTYGLETGLLVAIFFFANGFAPFDITGGGFFRQLWFAALIGFVCFQKKGRMGAAGFCLAVSALDRAFPLVFVMLPAVRFVKESWQRRSVRHGQTRLLAAFAVSGVLLGGLSATTTGGMGAWAAWYKNVRAHNDWFYINQISMRNLFIVNPMTIPEITAEGWDEALWVREREALDDLSQNTLRALRVVMLALLIALMAKEKEAEASLALLSFTPFLLFYPADYYCVVLAITFVGWQRAFGIALAMSVLQVLFWVLCLPFSTPTHVELLHWIVALCLVSIFAVSLSVRLARHARGQPAFRKACLGVLAGSALMLAGGVAADVATARADRDTIVLDLSAKDVGSLRGTTASTEQMLKWGCGWSKNDHLVFVAEGPGAQATVQVPAGQPGPHTVQIDYSTAPPFGTITLSVNGRSPYPPVNLYSPRVGIRSLFYRAVVLAPGLNDFTFTVEGKDPASMHYHFAIDRIVVRTERPASGDGPPAGTRESRLAALDDAVSWVETHPADAFDGGRRGICTEILMFHRLASHPDLAANRSSYVQEIQKRLHTLDTQFRNRPLPTEYELLTAVAYVARQRKLEFRAWDAVADAVRRYADAYYADGTDLRPLCLCEYLNRLSAVADVPCAVNRSILHRVFADRRLQALLAGEVDRAKAGAVSNTFHSIAADVYALTDFGTEPAPSSGIFEDSAFWAGLCEDGLRWGREAGNLEQMMRLVGVARCLGVESAVCSLQPTVDAIIRHQVPDGSFAVADCSRANPYRDGVLAAILAIASSL